MQWFAAAPANIALIKYMGKKDEALNIAANPSLSYTLDHLSSHVSLESIPGKKDYWEPLSTPGAEPFQLSIKAQTRFLDHLAFIKGLYRYEGAFLLKSTTNFPQAVGLASSASSFAALTKCTLLALTEIQGMEAPSLEKAAQISRQGSGSSCRSFFSPWAIWEEDKVGPIDLPYKKLIHEVILISHEQKAVSSSEAHRRIKKAVQFEARIERATLRLQQLIKALETKDWGKAHSLCWDEFQDMHALFQEADEPFSYLTEDTKKVLKTIQKFWDRLGDGPIVTMDAGPNIHLLYRMDQESLAREFKNHYLLGNYDVL